MKRSLFTIAENGPLTESVWRMVLRGDLSEIQHPGQFVNIALNGFYLRRPISVCDWTDDSLTIIYKVVGRGTAHMATLTSGQTLDLLTGLGNGYSLEEAGDKPLLIGGGVGIPPLYALAKKLMAQGCAVTVILGFQRADEVFYEEEFKALGAMVLVTTADGSHGIKGFVTDAAAQVKATYLYTCGPEGMLRALHGAVACEGQFSFEERMGCGFGACMGCSCETKYGAKRICKEGPVLRKEEILW